MKHLPQTGSVLASKYQLVELIGEGGFSSVFAAVDLTINRRVAVKLLKAEAEADPVMAARFLREARLVAGLSDPHTIQMFDFGRTEHGVMFMVFELLDGEDLSTFMANHAPLAQAVVEKVVRQVLYSLREAHDRGLLHRDIKPGNVRIYPYMDDPLRVKLMDFGIARPAGDDARVTKTGAIIGTPRYMSPEQFTGEELTPASDLFSLGLVAIEMLTGAPAPRQDIILGGSVEIGARGGLGALLTQLLQPEARDRPQSVAEALALLDGDAGAVVTTHPMPGERPIVPAPPPPAEQARPPYALAVGAPHLHLAPTESKHLPVGDDYDCVGDRALSLAKHDEKWQTRNACKGKPEVEKVRGSTCFTWTCGAPYVSCHLSGGMPWPGRGPRDIDFLNCDGVATDFPVQERMWAFFDRATTWRREQ